MLAVLAAIVVLPMEAHSLPKLKVLPWNGYKAAVSLTFDDGDPSHWQIAVPALNRRHLRATFFLIAGRLLDEAEWLKVAQAGHEIGNHSMTHDHPAGFDSKRVEEETAGAQKHLASKFGTPAVSFAFPFGETTPLLETAIARGHIGARGGAGPSYYLKPAQQPDWFNIPSQVTLTATPVATYIGWIDTALKEGAWTVLMIHGIEGTPWGWEPIPKKVLETLLDRLEDPQIWVAPFGAVCAYWRAEKILENTQPTAGPAGTVYRWHVPPHFPKGVKLKIKLDGAEGIRALGRSGQPLASNAGGVYSVDFDAGELAIK